MLNIADTELLNTRKRAIELALQIPTNNYSADKKADTSKVLDDAQLIFNWMVKDKESAPQ